MPHTVRVVLISVVGLLLAPVGVQAGQISLAWDPSPDGSVVGYTLYYGTSSGSYSGSIDVGNTMTYTVPGLTNGVMFFFVVKGYTTTGVFSDPSNEVSGVPSNLAPSVINPGDITMRTGALVLAITATDPEFDTLTYTATGLPTGLAIDASTGVISGTVPVGTHTITVTVSDGALQASTTFTITGTTNSAPTLTTPLDQTNDTNDVINLQVIASDPDGDLLTFSATELPTGLTLDASTGRITGTPVNGTGGTHNVTVTVSDGALTASASFTWTVVDLNPGLVAAYGFDEGSGASAADQSGNGHTGTISGATWTTGGRFGQALSFDGVDDWVTIAHSTLLSLTTGMTLEAWVYPTANGSGTWRPVVFKGLTGSFVYSLSAYDAANFPVTVVVSSAQLDARGGSQLPLNTWAHLAATYDGTTLRIFVNGAQVASTAASGDLLMSTGSVWIGGNTFGSFFQGLIDEVRIYNVARTAAQIATDMNTAVVSVGSPPTMTNPGDRTNAENDVVSLQLVATDPDGDAITYSATGLPPSLTLNAGTGLISGTLSYTSAGVHTVVVTATAGGASDSQTFTWTVTNTNRAPVLTNPGAQTGLQGVALSLSMTATDADGDPLSWSAVGLPTGLAINASTGVIAGTPTTLGVFSAVVTVSDGTANAQASFTWTVASPLPGAVTPVSPSGTIATATPSFTWSAVPNVGYYYLVITDAAPASPTGSWHTPAQAGCAAGTGTCTVAAPRTLTSGLVQWQVLAWNTYGYGPWSVTMDVVVEGVDALLPAPAPVGPSGPIATRTPTYQWSPVSNVIWYEVSVTDALGTTNTFWYSPPQACASSPCTITPPGLLPVGPAEWRIRAWSTAGAGPWSSTLSFDVASSTPGQATLVAPSGATSSLTPTFTWNGVLGTSYYLLRITDRNDVTAERWYRPSDAGCPLGTEVCTVSPAIAVDPGPATWAVLTWNAGGYGPWSEDRAFSVEIADPLAGQPSPVSPTGAVAAAYPAYTWTAVGGTVLYRLSVGVNGGSPTYQWYTPAAAGCAASSQCAATAQVALQNGTAEWQVQSWTVNGHGQWSPTVALTVSVPAPSTPALVSPNGSATTSPSFVWNASTDAIYYYMRVFDSTGMRVERWLTPEQTGCAGGGVCTFSTGVTLNSGAGSWEAIAWNPTGYSGWSGLAFTVP